MKFTYGTIEATSNEYCTVKLFLRDKLVYICDLYNHFDAMDLFLKHNNIILLNKESIKF
jgi:hypothetical protein